MQWLVLFACIYTALAAVIGIDYGTDFTKASVVAPNANFEIVLTPDTARKDASGLVFRTGDDFERIYGSPGLTLSPRFPETSFYSLKPLLGAGYGDAVMYLFEETHPGMNIVEHPGRHSIAFNVSDSMYSVEELVAMSLSSIKERSTELVRHKAVSNTAIARDAAVSVPGFWTTRQRQALKDSIGLAGLDLIGLVDDGVAVAVNYAAQPATTLSEEPQYIVVYDMGAESTTATVISLVGDKDQGTSLEVLGLGAQPILGGRALTAMVREQLYEKFIAANPKLDAEAVRTSRTLNRLWREAERAKIVLSANTEVKVHIESLYKDYDLDVHLTRAEFEAAAAPQIEAVGTALTDSLKLFNGTQLPIEKLDAIVLAGGATRTPFVTAQLKNILGDDNKVSRSVNADESETLGTNLRGVALSGIFRTRSINITDRIPYSIEIAVDGSEEKTEIFAVGSKTDSMYELEITAKDQTSLALYENGVLQRDWTISAIDSAIESLSSAGPIQCRGPITVSAQFYLDQNHIVQLRGSEARCEAIQSISGDNDTVTEKPTVKTRRLSPRLVSTRCPVPVGTAEKRKIEQHLRDLDRQAADKRYRGELHNRLEGMLYRLRELVPDHPSLDHFTKVVEDGFSGAVTELEKIVEEAISLHTHHSENIGSDSESEVPSGEASSTVTRETTTSQPNGASTDEPSSKVDDNHVEL